MGHREWVGGGESEPNRLGGGKDKRIGGRAGVRIPLVEVKNTKIAVHVLSKMMIPYSRFSRIYENNIDAFGDACFSDVPTSSVRTFRKINFWRNKFVCFLK